MAGTGAVARLIRYHTKRSLCPVLFFCIQATYEKCLFLHLFLHLLHPTPFQRSIDVRFLEPVLVRVLLSRWHVLRQTRKVTVKLIRVVNGEIPAGFRLGKPHLRRTGYIYCFWSWHNDMMFLFCAVSQSRTVKQNLHTFTFPCVFPLNYYRKEECGRILRYDIVYNLILPAAVSLDNSIIVIP